MAIISEKDEEGISREIKNYPQPADYLFKVESFSLLEKNGIERIESKTFEAGGHEWKIVVCPSVRNASDGDYLSIYLLLASDSRKEVNAIFRFFVFDQIRDWCLLVKGKSKRFDWVKNEWGYRNFISIDDLTDPSHGYIVDDTCLFGVEVFVSQSSGLRECFSISNIDNTYNYTWNITQSSKLRGDRHSDEFIVGGYKWELWLSTEGDSNHTGSSLSVFLVLLDTPNNSRDDRVKVQFTLKLKDWIDKNHLQKTDTQWFSFVSSSSNVWGWESFIQLEELKDRDNGFIVDDSCMIEAELTMLCATRQKSLSS
ncbi:hypothetical protein ACET3Z_012549 [Daucus carota]